MKKIPYGTVPGNTFVNEDQPFSGVRFGIITRVDPHHMKCDVKVLAGSEERFELDLTQALAGPRSFLGGIPEVNSMVVLGYRRRHKKLYDAVILGYLPSGNTSGLRFDPFSAVSPGEIDPADQNDADQLFGKTLRYKRILGKPGDIMGMSSAGAEMLLSKDVRFVNRAGDLFELRDTDRTLLSQAIHRVEADSAAYMFSGAIRRGAMDLPWDLFKSGVQSPSVTLPVIGPIATGSQIPAPPSRMIKDQDNDRYFGRDELSSLNPVPFLDVSGNIIDRINNAEEFPALVYSNSRPVFYASTNPATNFEDSLNGGSSYAFTERRVEIRHVTDLRQEVLEEIDGFPMDRPIPYIEQVLGTVVGNDPTSSQGQRQYGRVLKPRIFEDFDQTAPPSGFHLDEVSRSPGSPDEAFTMAGAYLFQVQPPKGGSSNKFAVAVSKQGKLFVNVPGSTSENYPARNVSAEVMLEGALKARIGAASPDRVSLHATMDGGIFLDVGANADGNSIDVTYRGAVKNAYRGGNNVDDVSFSQLVKGNAEYSVSGTERHAINGTLDYKVSGECKIQGSQMNLHGLNALAIRAGFSGLDFLVSGKSQFNYALQVMENIALGGKLSTILAGGAVYTIAAGAFVQNVLAGASSFNNPAGAFSIVVGTGALSFTTASGAVTLSTGAGAVAITAGGGAVAITGGAAINLTAPLVSIVSPQILLGGPAAALGVCRGIPMQPPGSPSLDWFTGIPLQGSAVVRSI